MPTSLNVRPSDPISRSLSGGPTACEARLALSMRTTTGAMWLSPVARSTRAAESPAPCTLTPLKMIAGTPVPEAVVVVGGVDHRRRIARLGPPRVDAVDVEHRVGDGHRDVLDRPAFRAHELSQVHALRRDDIIDVAEHRRVTVGGIGHLVQRKVRRPQLMVRAQIDRRIGIVCAAGIHLVDRTRIGAGAEMTRRACLDAVAADLHVPEERLSQRNGGLPIPDVAAEIRRFGNGDLPEVPRSGVAIRKQFVRQFTRAFALSPRAPAPGPCVRWRS